MHKIKNRENKNCGNRIKSKIIKMQLTKFVENRENRENRQNREKLKSKFQINQK